MLLTDEDRTGDLLPYFLLFSVSRHTLYFGVRHSSSQAGRDAAEPRRSAHLR